MGYQLVPHAVHIIGADRRLFMSRPALIANPLHASQVRQKAQYPSHPLYRYTIQNTSQRLMKPTTFHNS